MSKFDDIKKRQFPIDDCIERLSTIAGEFIAHIECPADKWWWATVQSVDPGETIVQGMFVATATTLQCLMVIDVGTPKTIKFVMIPGADGISVSMSGLPIGPNAELSVRRIAYDATAAQL